MGEPNRSQPVLEGLNAALRFLKWAGVLAVLAVMASGVTIVKPDEVALRLRFGRLTGETRADQVHGPGLLVSFPYLVDEVIRVPVKRVLEMNIDALRSRGAIAPRELDITRDGYALTGDHNLIQPRVLLKYQIADPVAWALNIVRPEARVHDAVVAALTRTLAEMPIDSVLVEGKRKLAATALRRAQVRLDGGASPWVLLVALEFTSLQPPAQVARYFDDVQRAFVEKKTLEEKARSYAEQEIPLAESEKVDLINRAHTFAVDTVSDARGEARAFLALLAEYEKAPDVVWRRLYLEGIEDLTRRGVALHLVPPGFEQVHILISGARARVPSGSGKGE
jgi:membrane protease subunit HflK